MFAKIKTQYSDPASIFFTQQIYIYLGVTSCSFYLLSPGDPAVGDAVNRQYFTDLSSYIANGFPINFISGEGKIYLVIVLVE